MNFRTLITYFSLGLSSLLLCFCCSSQFIHSNKYADYLIMERAKTGVVKLVSFHGGGGTGFHIKTASGETVIITNRHVCNMAEGNTLYAFDNSTSIKNVTIIKVDDNADLCMLTAANPLAAYTVSRHRPQVFDQLYSVGHPHLYDKVKKDGFFTGEDYGDTTYHKFEGCQLKEGKCQITQNIYSITIVSALGSSGSPVFNAQDEVVAVVFAIDTTHNPQEGMTYAVTWKNLRLFLGYK